MITIFHRAVFLLLVLIVAGLALLIGSILLIRAEPIKQSVRVLYLVPKDQDYHSEYQLAIEACVRELQSWYYEHLNKQTFWLNNPVVEVIHTPHDSDWYDTNIPANRPEKIHYTYYNALADAAAAIGPSGGDSNHGRFITDSDFVWLIYIDAPGGTGAGERGVAVLPRHDLQGLAGKSKDKAPIRRWIGGSGHELGHAFGLPHPDDDHIGALMKAGYANYPNCYLTLEDTQSLSDSPFLHDQDAGAVPIGTGKLLKVALIALLGVGLCGLWLHSRPIRRSRRRLHQSSSLTGPTKNQS